MAAKDNDFSLTIFNGSHSFDDNVGALEFSRYPSSSQPLVRIPQACVIVHVVHNVSLFIFVSRNIRVFVAPSEEVVLCCVARFNALELGNRNYTVTNAYCMKYNTISIVIWL